MNSTLLEIPTGKTMWKGVLFFVRMKQLLHYTAIPISSPAQPMSIFFGHYLFILDSENIYTAQYAVKKFSWVLRVDPIEKH